jgi:NAD(P)-dependent dehydrogenase (short-subunit alcohol dehydrogenase family)
MKNLKGKTAVVTGAGMGMGRDLSEKLLREGCSVALVDVKPDSLQVAEEELRRIGPCRGYVCDISDRAAVCELAGRIEADMEPPAMLVNNAGIVTAAPLMSLDDAAIERMIRVNLTALFWTCKAFLPAMLRRGEGHIGNVASAGGILALPNLSAYCASKFGVVGFTDSLRQEMRKLRADVGVTVGCQHGQHGHVRGVEDGGGNADAEARGRDVPGGGGDPAEPGHGGRPLRAGEVRDAPDEGAPADQGHGLAQRGAGDGRRQRYLDGAHTARIGGRFAQEHQSLSGPVWNRKYSPPSP